MIILLKKIISDADKAYYELDAPLYTDTDYDDLRNAYIKKYGSDALNYVPGGISNKFTKFRHHVPVTSLGKIKESDGIKVFREAVNKIWPVVYEPKLDGLTVVAYPNPDGKTCTFVTRGSGTEGEVLPNFISKYEGECCRELNYPVRGEVFMKKDVFDRINSSLPEDKKFSNARNAAAGILRNLERSEYIDDLSFWAYDILDCDICQKDKINYIQEHTNFETVSSIIVPEYNKDELYHNMDNIYKEYERSDIPVDGIVIKSNKNDSLREFGFTGHHPKNAFAFKLSTFCYATTLRSVIWQMGKQFLTPVAELEPVEIDGTIVSRATLHNAGILEEFNLHIGDTVFVTKANEVIPYIVEVIHNNSGEAITVPNKCPFCGSDLETQNSNGKKQLLCNNELCEERIIQKMVYICSKKVLNIDGMSIETCRKIYNFFVAKNDVYIAPYDFFILSENDIKSLPGFAAKSAKKLFNNIQKIKEESVDFSVFISSLCVPKIGNTVGKALMRMYGDINLFNIDLLDANSNNESYKKIYNKLTSMDKIGDIIAEIILSDDFLDTFTVARIYITKIKGVEINIKNENNSNNSKVLNFALTGKMERPRSYYENIINSHGHVVQSSVNKKTDYLIIADVNSQSSKAKKARDLNINIISPADLLNVIAN